jgi:predicted AlkP superfamily pyrophosphatase or phosphodiesterase
MKYSSVLWLFLFSFFVACTPVREEGQKSSVKLVVGIVVDQMRYEYLERFEAKFSNEGFLKLRDGGYSFANTHYDYIPTFTGPGHASVYTGVNPSIHGICANNWYNREQGSVVNCVYDAARKSVGVPGGNPVGSINLAYPTVGDVLKQSTKEGARVVSVAIKDRGAVLPGGQKADAAFWLDGESGKWITSQQYMDQLPTWVKEFNEAAWVDKYLQEEWTTYFPINEYTESVQDDNLFEVPFDTTTGVTFPYHLSRLKEKYGRSVIKYTPFGNSLTMQLAMQALEHEPIGIDDTTDMLLVSFSSTDYIGHRFGPRSVELEDAFIRLDRDLGVFIGALEKKVGKENLLVFLTSDHGVMEVPAYLKANDKPGGVYQAYKLIDTLNVALQNEFGVNDLATAFINDQIYLNEATIVQHNLLRGQVEQVVKDWLSTYAFVEKCYTAEELFATSDTGKLVRRLRNGYYKGRSGDLLFIAKEGWIDQSSEKGTTHGSGYAYDTHVPLMWYGAKIPAGKLSHQPVNVTDITPTLIQLLGIPLPSDLSGKPIPELTTNHE